MLLLYSATGSDFFANLQMRIVIPSSIVEGKTLKGATERALQWDGMVNTA